MSRTVTSSILLAVLGPALLATVATAAPPGSGLQGGTATDLSVSGKAAKASGSQLKYDVTLTASGSTANDATVELDPPAGARVDSSQVDAGTCSGTDPVTCVVPPFGSAGSVGITLRFTPRNPGPLRLDVTLTAVPADNAEAWNDVLKVIAARRQICDNRPTAGDDHIEGTPKDDILCGLGGFDGFWGVQGDDVMFGGQDQDVIVYAGAPNTTIDLRKQGIDVVGAAPTASGVSGHGLDSFTGIEHAAGGSHHDTIVGNDKRNRLFGTEGSDILLGFGGRDRIFGDAGKDDLIGGAGDDFLHGGPGTDTCQEESDEQHSCER